MWITFPEYTSCVFHEDFIDDEEHHETDDDGGNPFRLCKARKTADQDCYDGEQCTGGCHRVFQEDELCCGLCPVHVSIAQRQRLDAVIGLYSMLQQFVSGFRQHEALMGCSDRKDSDVDQQHCCSRLCRQRLDNMVDPLLHCLIGQDFHNNYGEQDDQIDLPAKAERELLRQCFFG